MIERHEDTGIFYLLVHAPHGCKEVEWGGGQELGIPSRFPVWIEAWILGPSSVTFLNTFNLLCHYTGPHSTHFTWACWRYLTCTGDCVFKPGEMALQWICNIGAQKASYGWKSWTEQAKLGLVDSFYFSFLPSSLLWKGERPRRGQGVLKRLYTLSARIEEGQVTDSPLCTVCGNTFIIYYILLKPDLTLTA